MPKLVDYCSRFAQIKEAVYLIALREGSHAITLPAVAAEIGVSISTVRRLLSSAQHLPRLGMDWVDLRWRTNLRAIVTGQLPAGDPAAPAVNALLRELPSTPGRADDARVLRVLTTGFPRAPWAVEAKEGRARLMATLVDGVVPDHLSEEARRREVARLLVLVVGLVNAVCDDLVRPEDCVPLILEHLDDRATAWGAGPASGVA